LGPGYGWVNPIIDSDTGPFSNPFVPHAPALQRCGWPKKEEAPLTEEEKAVAKRERDAKAQKTKRQTANHNKWYAKVKDNPEFKDKVKAIARKGYQARALKEAIAVSGRPKPTVCDLCGQGGKICFDHCHSTKKFRGWLCNHCNLALGHVKDDPKLLRKLADYVEAV
jgi:hypothetical protein